MVWMFMRFSGFFLLFFLNVFAVFLKKKLKPSLRGGLTHGPMAWHGPWAFPPGAARRGDSTAPSCQFFCSPALVSLGRTDGS